DPILCVIEYSVSHKEASPCRHGSFGFRPSLRGALCVVAAAALVLLAMIATPLVQPPELRSISETARAVDRRTMPAVERFSARDGTRLAYRHYPPRGPAAGPIAILIH